MKNNIQFPLAIKVNAWLILIYPLLLIIVLAASIFLNDNDLIAFVKNIIFDTNEPILSIIIDIEIIVVYILVWIMYINKKYTRYIVNIFYLDYFFNILVNIDSFKEEPILTGIFFILEGIPILWLYLSQDVKNFINNQM